MVGLRGQLEISLYIVQHLGGTFRFDLALDAHLSLEYSLFSQKSRVCKPSAHTIVSTLATVP